MQHFQALLRLDTTSPPGNERRAVEYLEQVLRREGITYQVFAKDPQRPNLVARIKGNGKKRPILVMGHTDVVSVDPQKWSFPPFGATRDGGYVYGRGAVDDKDSVVAGLMLMLTLKRNGTALDRDVIFLAESGEEGAPEFGAQFMIDNHFDAIDAEYLLCRGRRRRALGWPRDAGDCWDDRERAASDSAHRARDVGPWLGAAEGQRHRAALVGAGEDLRMGAAVATQRDDDRLFQDAGDCRAAGDGATLQRCAEHQSESRSRSRRVDAREPATALVDAPHVARPDNHRWRLSLQRHPLRGQSDC